MAIYSFNHDSFGKTTNRAGAAGDNARYNARENETRLEQGRQDGTAAGNAAYNAREEVTYAVRSHVIPSDPKEAEAWFREQEGSERKNARMSDRFIGALPRELTPEQCIEAVERFCREVTQDRIPWHFALHLELDQRDKPDWNPHAHIIFRDRDIETGKRFLHTTAGPKERAQLDKKGIEYWTTRDFREAWGDHMNRALFRAGHEARIDHRSLKDQGIDRDPQIHEGPASRKAAEKGHEFQSQDRSIGDRTIPYTLLDQGTRAERNAQIQERNAAREATGHSPADPRTAEAFKEMIARQQPRTQDERERRELLQAQAETRRAMQQDQKRDREALRAAHNVQHEEHKAWGRKLYAKARQAAFEQVKEQSAHKWKAVRAIGDKEKRVQAAETLKQEQKELYVKTAAARVAELRPQKNEAWQALVEQQAKERLELRNTHREENAALTRQQVAERLSVDEQKRSRDLQQDTNRIAARFGGNQGMANQQKAAVQAIQLKQDQKPARDKNGAQKQVLTGNSFRDARTMAITAAIERSKRGKIREGLNAMRHDNQLRATTFDRSRTQSGRGVNIARAIQADRQSQARQAAHSGRTLTSEERANAPHDVRERLDRQDSKVSHRSWFSSTKGNDRPGGKGRSGGGRGR